MVQGRDHSGTSRPRCRDSLRRKARHCYHHLSASTLRAERMAEAMLDSTARIFDLIRAIKDYSYMDQAPIQDVDVPQSLENTLAMLQSRLQHVVVHAEL